MSCLSIIISAIAGVFVGILAGGFIHEQTDSEPLGAVGGFFTWCFCVWVGGNIGDGSFAKYFKNATGNNKTNRKGVSLEALVEVHFVNSKGIKHSLKVARHSARLNGDFVIAVLETGATINLNKSRILNPEVLGLPENPQNKDEVVSRDCPNCPNGNVRPWQGEMRCWNCGHVIQDQEEMERLGVEAEPPVLHPKSDMLGDPSGPALRYRRRDGTSGVIYFAKDSVEIIGNRVNLSPQGGFERYAIALDQVHNPEVLEPAAPDVPEDELPPMLEPQEIYVGDVTGKELRYSRQDGSTGTIYFDPDTVEKVDNALSLRPRVVLSPQGRPECYSIALEKVHNPEVLFEVPELPPLLMPEPEPEPEPAQFQPGTRVVIDEVPLDSYEAVQVMRRLKPELGPFEILEVLKHEPATLLQGYGEERALSIGEELEATGCTVHLQTVDVPAS